MRVAIPSDDQRLVSGHVGRCAGFIVAEVVDGAEVGRNWRRNTFTGHARGETHGPRDGTGRHAGVLAALADCGSVVSRGMGRALHEELVAAGIEAVTTDLVTVDDVIQAVARGELVDHPDRRCDHGHDHDHDHDHSAQ